MIRRPAALLTLLTLLVAAPVARAHEGNPNYRSVVKSVTPNTPGLNVEILNFDDRVLLHNTSNEDVEIFGYENDEPYAQIKADGTVLVNTNSKAYYLNEDRQGDAAVPQDLPSEPAWKELSKSGRSRTGVQRRAMGRSLSAATRRARIASSPMKRPLSSRPSRSRNGPA